MENNFLPFCKPCINEDDINSVIDVLRSGWITTGSKCAALESELAETLGGRHVVALASATAGIDLYLAALGIGPGDEVITPSLTWVSAPNLITLRGATPVFVDVNKDTLMVSAEAIEQAITEHTKLIIPVHFAGVPLDIDAINEVAKRHNIPVLEDAAHAMGTRYKDSPIGSHGDAVFSLQAIKNVTGAEGGLFVTESETMATRIKQLRFHGLGADSYGRESQGRSPQAQVLEPGYKYNLPDINAALALSQFRRLATINSQRATVAEMYNEQLSDIQELRRLSLPNYSHKHAWHLFIVRLEDTAPISRNDFIEAMKQHGIGVGIHFQAVHLQHYYRKTEPRHPLANTEWNSSRICSLPLFPDMTREDVNRVVETIKSIFAKK